MHLPPFYDKSKLFPHLRSERQFDELARLTADCSFLAILAADYLHSHESTGCLRGMTVDNHVGDCNFSVSGCKFEPANGLRITPAIPFMKQSPCHQEEIQDIGDDFAF